VVVSLRPLEYVIVVNGTGVTAFPYLIIGPPIDALTLFSL